MSTLSDLAPAYITRLEHDLSTAEAEGTRLRESVTAARGEAERWQGACEVLAVAIRRMVDESKSGRGPRALRSGRRKALGPAADEATASSSTILGDSETAEMIERLLQSARADEPFATLLEPKNGQVDSYLALVVRDAILAARKGSAAELVEEAESTAEPKVQWVDGVAPLEGSWIEVAYEDVTYEVSADDESSHEAVGLEDDDTTIDAEGAESVADNIIPFAAAATVFAEDPTDEAAEIVADEPARATATKTSAVELIAYPFVQFSSLRTFEKALWAIPGIQDVRLCNFGTLTLQFRIKYRGRVPLAKRLSALRGFPGTVTADAPGRLVLELATEKKVKKSA